MSEIVLEYARRKSPRAAIMTWLKVGFLGSAVVGVVAAALLLVPTFTNSNCGAGSSPLQTFRGQIELYKIQHDGMPPDAYRFWNQMMYATNIAGETIPSGATDSYPIGPYIQAAPFNPANGKCEIGDMPSPDVGWVYRVKGSEFVLQAVNGAGDGVLSY